MAYSFVTHWFELYGKIQLILYCEHIQLLAKEVSRSYFSLHALLQSLDTYNISHTLLRPTQFLKKFLEILEWSILQK